MNGTKATSNLELVMPDPDKDAVIAFGWFNSPYGKDTLFRMGNAENEIKAPILEGERAILEAFVEPEQENKQITQMIQYYGKTIGAAWIA